VPQLVVANSEPVQARVAERRLDLGFIEGDSHLRTLVTDVCCEEVVNEFVRFAKERLAASRGAEINLLPERLMRVALPGSPRA
jgi:hypothetical protein